MQVGRGMTNQSNQVDFANQLFISKSAYKPFLGGKCIISFYHMIQYVFLQ